MLRQMQSMHCNVNNASVYIGGNQMKVWDILGGGRHLQTLANHQKTITSMTFDGSGTRILTGSLDHHVKIYSIRDFKVVHNIKYPAPIQSIGVSVRFPLLATSMRDS